MGALCCKINSWWSLLGPVDFNKGDVCAEINFINQLDDIPQQMEKLWSTDFKDIGCDKTCLSTEDKEVMSNFTKNTTMIDGHYQVPLPWKNEESLPNNLAHIRLKYLKKIRKQ